MKIISIAENYEWISLMNKIVINPEHTIHWVTNEIDLYEQIYIDKPCIVFLPNSASYDVYSVCNQISKSFPLTTTLLIFRSEEELDMKSALKSRAGDVIFLSSPIDMINQDIKLAIENSGEKPFQQHRLMPKKSARVLTVCSTKGGVGKTTVAVNLAAAFGKKLKVVVVDLDLQFGDVAMFFDIKPKKTIYDWAKEDKEGKQIENYLTHYKYGISILAAPQRPEFAEVITGDDVRNALNNLKQLFDVVIIDASSYMNEIGLVALENSDDILLMTYLDLPTLKNTKILLDTLISLQLGERVRVVLNRQTRVKGITTSTVEKVVGKRIFSSLPVMEKAMVSAVNEGKPLSYSHPRSLVAKRISQMADTLLKIQPPIEIQEDKQLAPVGGRI
jgi:pilus assembly protein CpaE